MAPAEERRPAISSTEFERRIEAIHKLLSSGREQEAQDAIAESLEDWPPEAIRRELQRLGYQIRRDRFYQQHPLHFSLVLDRDRYAFGEAAEVQLRITNLGAEQLTLPARYRSLLGALTFGMAEESVLFLKLKTQDADGLGSRWGSERLMEVPLEEDLILGPGGTARITAQVPLEDGGRSLYRVIQIGAIYRPIAVVAEGGDRRYDPLEFQSATARVFQASQIQRAEGGVELLRTCLEGEALDRPETLFVAAMGLRPEDLAEGIGMLARAAPSLEPMRRRCAVAALQLLTGHLFGGDPVRFVSWWQATGRHLVEEQLVLGAGLRDRSPAGRLMVGESGSPR
ncbi:MAG: hypothetical protein V2A76_15840 [Planctomycetota bacterium]